MKKAKYFFMGIAVLLLIGQTPQYLYRDLDMRDFNILSVSDFVEMKKIHWTGGADNMGAGYYISDGVNDDLYGSYSMPVSVGGGPVVLDSMFICIWTQGNEDYIDFDIVYWGCAGSRTAIEKDDCGSGSSGWESISFPVYNVEAVDSCHILYAECANNGATDIRLRYCAKLKYHTED